MFKKLMNALGGAGGKGSTLKALRNAIKSGNLDKATVRPLLVDLLESPPAMVAAYDTLASAADDAPRDPAPLYWRAWLMVHSMGLGIDPVDAQNLKDTRFLLKRARTLGWDAHDADELRGELEWIGGDPRAARETWRAVVAERPKPDLCNRLADLELYLSTPRVQTMDEELTEEDTAAGRAAALALFDQALSMDPDHAASLVGKAHVLLQQGDAAGAKPLAERAHALGYASDTLSQVDVQLERAFPKPAPAPEPEEAASAAPAPAANDLTIELLGIVVDGSGFIEKGSQPLEPRAFVPDAAEAFCIEFATRLKIAEGSAVVRHRDASFFYYVIGDGENTGVKLMEDADAQAEFQRMFDKQWKELEEQGIV